MIRRKPHYGGERSRGHGDEAVASEATEASALLSTAASAAAALASESKRGGSGGGSNAALVATSSNSLSPHREVLQEKRELFAYTKERGSQFSL